MSVCPRLHIQFGRKLFLAFNFPEMIGLKKITPSYPCHWTFLITSMNIILPIWHFYGISFCNNRNNTVTQWWVWWQSSSFYEMSDCWDRYRTYNISTIRIFWTIFLSYMKYDKSFHAWCNNIKTQHRQIGRSISIMKFYLVFF